MREKPTTSVSDLRLISSSALHNTSTTVQYNNSTIHNFSGMLDNNGGMTAGQCAHLIIKGNGYFYLDAENLNNDTIQNRKRQYIHSIWEYVYPKSRRK